ncbi:MAG TPA: hypothetical protein DDW50_09580 [Firmicutes bacterium]|jgi:hypothetical protein|nr:hypothetical protein [Bacillota bacterium]
MATTSIHNLEYRIEMFRMKMQNSWNKRGYTDEAVPNANIELDQLLNGYQRLYN